MHAEQSKTLCSQKGRLVGRLLLTVPLVLCASFAFAADHCASLRAQYQGVPFEGSASSYKELGVWLAHRNERACALQAFLSAIAKDGSSWEANYNAGELYMAAKDPQSASPYLARAVASKPESVPSRIAYGEALEKLNQIEEAETIYRDGLAFAAQSPLLLSNLANLLAQKREYGAAIYYWRQAIALDPENNQYQLLMAVAFTRSGQYDKSIAVLKALVQRAPDFEPGYFSLGAAYAGKAEFVDAAEAYLSALKLRPTDNDAQFSLAQAFMVLLRYEEARPLLSGYVATHPEDARALSLLGVTNSLLGNLSEAEQELHQAVQLTPESYDAQYNLGRVLQESGKSKEAVAHLETSLSLRPDSLEAHFQISKAYKTLHEDKLKDEQIALIEKQNATRADQTKAAVLGTEGTRAFSAGDIQRALENYKNALSLDPWNARLYYDLSLVYGKAGDTASEEKALLEAETLDPTFAMVHDQLGLLYLRAGDDSKAQVEFQDAIKNDPSFSQALSNLGVLLARSGENAKAERLMTRAIESDSSFVEAYVNLGLILAAEGKLTDGLRVENDALAKSPNDAGAHAAKGSIEATLRHAATPAIQINP